MIFVHISVFKLHVFIVIFGRKPIPTTNTIYLFICSTIFQVIL